MISIENLTVVYSNGQLALEDINIQINSGVITGLVGMNGAGKSSLFKAIMGFIEPSQGKILVQGMDVKQAIKKNFVAYVPQSEDIDWNFPLLVEHVVMMGRYSHMGWLRRASKQDYLEVDKALERVGLLDLRQRQIGELSGGQKKRMFVARALAQNSTLILLDEPFTGVDITTEASLVNLFKELVQAGKNVLVSTHNLGSVPNFCDEVLLLNCRLIASGEVTATFSQENLSKAFGGMLRHQIFSKLHKDKDKRSVTVLMDDESPLVLYGDNKNKEIIN